MNRPLVMKIVAELILLYYHDYDEGQEHSNHKTLFQIFIKY